MKKAVIMVLLIFSILSWSNVTYAEPTSNIRYLMNDSITMLDWGMYQLEMQVDAFAPKDCFPYVYYDWDKNRIIITLDSIGIERPTEVEAKKWCRKSIGEIKSCFQIDPEKGKPYAKNGCSSLHFKFKHRGYKDKSLPENLYKELDNITVIKARALFKSSGKKVRAINLRYNR